MKSRVVFADSKLKDSFEQLKHSKGEKQRLYSWLDRAFDDLAENAFTGIQIPKRLIPDEYFRKYHIENLWKYNLPGAWRLLYSVARDEVIVVSIVLDWLPHKEYERKFKY